MKKIIYILVMLLLISTMLISGFLLFKEMKENKEQEEIFEQLLEITENNVADNREKYQELFEQNEDMVAWIKIENTNIDYPVMQTKDRPDYYLRRNFNKEYSYYGTPYIEENCNIDTSDNLIIYGHHIKNYQMFGILEKYKNEKFYKEHKIIEFTTKEENAKYEIIAVFTTVAYSKDGFKYYEFINMQEKGEFNTFIRKCKELSFFNIEQSADFGDKLITLSTCEYSRKNGRLVVVAKKLCEEVEVE